MFDKTSLGKGMRHGYQASQKEQHLGVSYFRAPPKCWGFLVSLSLFNRRETKAYHRRTNSRPFGREPFDPSNKFHLELERQKPHTTYTPHGSEYQHNLGGFSNWGTSFWTRFQGNSERKPGRGPNPILSNIPVSTFWPPMRSESKWPKKPFTSLYMWGRCTSRLEWALLWPLWGL